MRQKLILHIGTHKTGSTSIQKFLFFNRLWLRALGIYYPKPLNACMFNLSCNHSDLRDTALMEGKPRGAGLHPKLGSHDQRLAQYVHLIKTAKAPVNILSCEGWSSHLNRYAERLSVLNQHFDVQIVAFMRRPDFWIEKFYSQRIVNIEHGETRSFQQFLDHDSNDIYLYDRSKIFSWWARVFGTENVHVIPYEPRLSGFDLIEQFVETCGCNSQLAGFLPLGRIHSNPTLPPDLTEKVRRGTKAGNPMSVRDIHKLKRRAGGRKSAYLNEEQRAEILERAAPDMQKICATFVRDGRQELFPECPEAMSLAK